MPGQLLKGAAVMSAASVVRVALQTLVLPILARILTPHDYGLVSLAMPIVVFSMVISDGGLSAPLMRRTDDGDAVWSTAFWLVSAGGVLLALLIMLAAPLLAIIYREPKLTGVIMCLALTLVFQGLSTIPSARLQKSHQFHFLSMIEIASILCGAVALFALAFNGAGAWSLVVQQIVYWVCRSGGVLVASRWKFALRFDYGLIAQDLGFGWSILKVNMINFVTRSLDVFFLGLFRDSVYIGYYAMAVQVARLPANVILGPLHAVFLSHLVKLKESPAKVGAALVSMTALIASLVVPCTLTAAVASHDIFVFILSRKWQPSSEIYTWLVPGAAIQSIVFLIMPCLVALGRPDRQLRYTVLSSTIWVVFALIGARWGGGIGLALGIDAAFLIYAPFIVLGARSVAGYALEAYLTVIGNSLVGAAIAIALYKAMLATFGLSGVASVFAAGICALLGFGLSLYMSRAHILQSDLISRTA